MTVHDLGPGMADAGAEVMDGVASVIRAVNLPAARPQPDAAILDVNLRGEVASPLADLLHAGA